MSDKFPALDDVEIPIEGSEDTDFLKREQELLGDEFKSEQDPQLEDDDDEFTEFESQFPAVDSQVPAVESVEESASEFVEPAAPAPKVATEAIKEWKERRDLEISQRDAADKEKTEQTRADALKHIDGFYENYNKTKEEQLELTRKEAEEFINKRDNFLAEGATTWDRVLQLINLDDATVVEGRDKTRFKELLLKLKGNQKAPGAAGY